MPYDLTSAEERRRLLIALLHEGGSEDDQCYLADAVHAGYVLTPPPDHIADAGKMVAPVDQKTREDMADCLSNILSNIGGWLEDDELTRNVYELIAIARRNTPQPASNPCALPEDAAAAKEALGG